MFPPQKYALKYFEKGQITLKKKLKIQKLVHLLQRFIKFLWKQSL